MSYTYKKLKEIIGKDSFGRFELIHNEILELSLEQKIYEINSPRGKDKHISVDFQHGNKRELWLTANYDTYNNYPSANNNASGVIALLGLAQQLSQKKFPVGFPIDAKLLFLDAGLDPRLVSEGKRNQEFIPGSELLLTYLMDNEIGFIDRYEGAITIQAVGKGELCVFLKTGKKTENSTRMNNKLVSYGKTVDTLVDVKESSPLADNISFLKEGLDATVLTRYHEGAWHRMQTIKDDFSNVNTQAVEETINFLGGVLGSYLEIK